MKKIFITLWKVLFFNIFLSPPSLPLATIFHPHGRASTHATE